jgi:hypothetical protein
VSQVVRGVHLLIVLVGDDVKINIDIEATQQA